MCSASPSRGLIDVLTTASIRTAGRSRGTRALLAQADWCDQPEASVVPLFFALATPESVLAVLSGEIAASFQNRTFHAHLTSPFFSADAGLWAFS